MAEGADVGSSVGASVGAIVGVKVGEIVRAGAGVPGGRTQRGWQKPYRPRLPSAGPVAPRNVVPSIGAMSLHAVLVIATNPPVPEMPL